MRIIAGKHKGLTIPLPKGGEIRPTTDRAKESLFSILSSRYDLTEVVALDLFCGSGNIAIEFVSRGSTEVTAVEKNRRVVKQIQAFTIAKGIDNVKFRCQDVLQFLKSTTEKYDIVFADPPYHMKNILSIPDVVRENMVLKPNGLLIVEHESNLSWTSPDLVESRKYGQSVFSMFQFDVSLDT